MFLLAVDFDHYAFACDGPFLGIPHGLNVLTNLPFLFIGLWGLYRMWRGRCASGLPCFDGLGLWLSTALLCFGSGAYHYFLNPEGLGVDRLCIAGIMAFFGADSLVVTLGWKPDWRRSALFLGVSLATVVAWYFGATMLLYGGLQVFGAIAIVSLYVRAMRSGRISWKYLKPVLLFIGLYAAAKLFEGYDERICNLTGVFGGHPVKHLLSAAGLAAIVPLTTRSRDPGPGAPESL